MLPPIPRFAARGLSTLALLAALPALAQEAPVRAVTLFEAGLAELTRDTGTAREVTLSVPLRDVNDVLKSLLPRGQGITGARLALDGATPVEDAFASLPFPPAAATDLATLLASVPGLRVRLSDRAYPEGQEGTLMEVREDCTDEGGCETRLTLLSDGGALTRHIFDEALDLTILDPEIAGALAQGLGALREAASGQVRAVRVTLDGTDIRNGALTYVVAAPAWKTSYRALTGDDGEVDLQAWAVIENATGEDWEDVALTLSSGSPRTLTADLHGRDWRWRETVDSGADPFLPEPMLVIEPEAPRVAPNLAPGLAADAAEVFAAPAPLTASAAQAEGVLDSRFAFPDPVDLAAGEMASLPFLADALQARHLSLYEGRLQTRTANPDMVLEIVNDLGVRLPSGIMTVSDETGGYVGDAEVPLVAPGETRAVRFGQDRRLRVEETVGFATRQVSVRAAGGVLRITSQDLRDVTYRATSPSGEARDLVIDHPLTPDWTTTVTQGPTGEERQDDDGRRFLRVTLPVSGPDGAALVVRDVHPYESIIAIGDLGEDDLLAWAGESADPATRAYLEAAATLRRDVARAEDALTRAEETQADLSAGQARVRDNLSSVPSPSEANDRFLADLLDLEDRLAAATAERSARRDDLARARAAFSAHLAGD